MAGTPIPGLRADQLHVFVDGLVLPVSVGILPHEHLAPQPVRFDIDLVVAVTPPLTSENIADTVSYADVVAEVKAICAAGHIALLETLAERVAEAVLADRRVEWVRVGVAKPQIIAEAAGVGIAIARSRADRKLG